MKKNLLCILASLFLASLPYTTDAKNSQTECPKGHLCLINASLIGAKNFRTENQDGGTVNLCDLVLVTNQNTKYIYTENYCRNLNQISFLFKDKAKITLVIKNKKVISINWCELSDKYPDMLFAMGSCMRPFQLKIKKKLP